MPPFLYYLNYTTDNSEPSVPLEVNHSHVILKIEPSSFYSFSIVCLKNCTMDFDSAVKIINRLLIKKQPHTFNSSWIRGYAPKIYRFIQKNIRREIGGIDWDRVTRALDHKFPRRWITSRRNGTKPYRSKARLILFFVNTMTNFIPFSLRRIKMISLYEILLVLR